MTIHILVLCARPGSHDWNSAIEKQLRLVIEGILGISTSTNAEYAFVQLEAVPIDTEFRFAFGRDTDSDEYLRFDAFFVHGTSTLYFWLDA